MKFTRRLCVVVTATILLAACASNPAPVTNYSFGGNGQPAASAPAAQATPAAGGGAKTFGLGSHANGTVTAAGYTVARGDTLYSIAFAHGMDVRDLAALNGIAAPYVIHPGQVLRLSPSTPIAAAPAGGVAAAGAAPVTPRAVAATPPPASPPAPAPTPTPTPTQPSAPVFGPVTTQTLTASGVAPAATTGMAPATAVASSTAAPAAAIPVPPPAAESPVSIPAIGASRTVAGIAWQWPAAGKVIGGFTSGKGGDGAGLDIAGNAGDPVRAAAAGTVVYSGDGLIGYGELIIIKHNDTYLSAYGHNSKRLVKEGQHVGAGQEIALMGASGAPRVELHFEIRKDGKPVDPLGFLPQKGDGGN
ncbi:MAG: LysM peptidoglycan-binding domain-containing protein [Rhodanobacteraceae bacterium]|nr:MAG: LysM peptidoglycan-binding domain-containing protein [Rhodanobacteraceae bacterium]